VQGACDVTCEVGFQDCDGVDTNGCERPGTDPCANVVFLTNQSFSPDFGGVEVADAACQNAAELAGIPGTFMAWLSDATSSPSTRFTHSSHPYVRVDGQLVAANWNNLTSGIIGNPINVTETGAPVSMAKVLTGTNQSGGTHPSANCAGWSSLTGNGGVGNSWQTASDWTLDLSSGLSLCSAIGSQRLYCFQQ